jgi:hypothetical protein
VQHIPDASCSDNLRPACSSCQQIGTPCEYIRQDASTLDAASLRIIDHLSVIERLVRDIHPSSAHRFSSPSTGSSHQRPPAVTWPRGYEKSLASGRAAFILNLDAGQRAATDQILQWPVIERLLFSLQRFKFTDLHGTETYSYLDDVLTQSKSSASPGLSEVFSGLSSSISISTERSDIERLVDQYFRRVNIKNPILNRRVLNQYCQRYYEHGPLFNLETCLVLLTCALGAISTDFDPLGEDQSSGSSPYPPASLANHRLSHCYFVAAEKRLGAALSNVDFLSIQCLCLAG